MKDKPVILAVDDEPQNTSLLEAFLLPQGYEIVKAASGKEALEKLFGNQIDLVLLDIMMPTMSGFEVLEKLRADKKTRLIPVVMVTALHETEAWVKAFDAGCDDFISKPFEKHELLARVKSLLRIKFLHDEVITERKMAEVKLKKRADELNTMVNMMAGRELRMAELKKVINKLRSQLEEAGMEPVANDPLHSEIS